MTDEDANEDPTRFCSVKGRSPVKSGSRTNASKSCGVWLGLPILVSIDIANLWRYRKTWRGRVLKIMLPTAAIGIAIGAATFHLLDPTMFRFGLGILCFIFIAERLAEIARL